MKVFKCVSASFGHGILLELQRDLEILQFPYFRKSFVVFQIFLAISDHIVYMSYDILSGLNRDFENLSFLNL